MNPLELLKTFLQVQELSTVGSPQERAAFIALRIDGRTVREAAQAIGISKSHVSNLADLFQAKLIKRIMELRRKGTAACSAEYRTLHKELSELMSFDDDWGGPKIGKFDTNATSQEDWAEIRGTSLRFDDE